jgi:hypothetical protein
MNGLGVLDLVLDSPSAESSASKWRLRSAAHIRSDLLVTFWTFPKLKRAA